MKKTKAREGEGRKPSIEAFYNDYHTYTYYEYTQIVQIAIPCK